MMNHVACDQGDLEGLAFAKQNTELTYSSYASSLYHPSQG